MYVILLLLAIYSLLFFLPGRLKTTTIKPEFPTRRFNFDSDPGKETSGITYGKNLPEGYEWQALQALSYYPELKNTKIEFRMGNFQFAHTCRPKIPWLLNPFGARAYLITISKSLDGPLSDTLFGRLPLNAQIGVLGHELAHILDYEQKSAAQLIMDGLGYGFYNYRKQFENDTDLRTIRKGLGYQLLAWSKSVHHLLEADGRGDLYFSPERIQSEIASDPTYQNSRSS